MTFNEFLVLELQVKMLGIEMNLFLPESSEFLSFFHFNPEVNPWLQSGLVCSVNYCQKCSF